MPFQRDAQFGCAAATRRNVLAGSAGMLLTAPFWSAARAETPPPDLMPVDSHKAFMDWALKNRPDNPKYLEERWERFEAMVANRDIRDERNKRAFLMTPREEFVRPYNLSRAYAVRYQDIGFGVTISGPHIVGRMTTTIDVQPGEKILEVGTGSGYQSAYLSNLTDKVFSIEIIKPLAERTRGVYDALIARGYHELKHITTKNADGYYGWQENAPFDKVIVTCGIDHVPPPLLEQMKPGGIMVIPVGPPGAQHVLKVVKQQAADGSINVVRSDIYNGRVVPFVPFTKLVGDKIIGTHN